MKRCPACEQEKSDDEFGKNKSKPDGLQVNCRSCKRLYDKTYYQSNKASQQERVNRNRRVSREVIQAKMVAYFKDHPCVDCGNPDIRVLEFDHLRDKSFDVGSMVAQAVSWPRIMVEIQKCEVVCANCHRIRTGQRADSYRNKAWASSITG